MEQNTQQFDNTGPYDRGGGQHERYANRHAGFKKRNPVTRRPNIPAIRKKQRDHVLDLHRDPDSNY